VHHCDSWRIRDQLDVTRYLISLDILFGVVSVLQASACNTDTTPTQTHRNSNTHRTKNNTANVVIQQNSRKLLMMDILISETCWAHKKWKKITSDIKLVFYSSTIYSHITAEFPNSSIRIYFHTFNIKYTYCVNKIAAFMAPNVLSYLVPVLIQLTVNMS